MGEFKVSRAHLKSAVDQKNWDLLDKLLEIDSAQINDNSLYTDTWGEWWGMLLEVIRCRSVDGVRVLLKHGAQSDLASWGDGISRAPLEVAEGQPEILVLLRGPEPPVYVRQTDPALPFDESPEENSVNRQGEIREAAGLVFQTDCLVDHD